MPVPDGFPPSTWASLTAISCSLHAGRGLTGRLPRPHPGCPPWSFAVSEKTAITTNSNTVVTEHCLSQSPLNKRGGASAKNMPGAFLPTRIQSPGEASGHLRNNRDAMKTGKTIFWTGFMITLGMIIAYLLTMIIGVAASTGRIVSMSLCGVVMAGALLMIIGRVIDKRSGDF